jgi:hypothetical protein
VVIAFEAGRAGWERTSPKLLPRPPPPPPPAFPMRRCRGRCL